LVTAIDMSQSVYDRKILTLCTYWIAYDQKILILTTYWIAYHRVIYNDPDLEGSPSGAGNGPGYFELISAMVPYHRVQVPGHGPGYFQLISAMVPYHREQVAGNDPSYLG
jgi:hypothetical protein